MNLATAFVASADRHAHKAAIFCGDEEITYQSLRQGVLECAAALSAECQVQPQDRVALWCRNSPQFPAAFLATLCLGAVVIPINNFLKAEEVAHILNDAGVNTVIVDSSLTETAAAVANLRPELKFFWIDHPRSARPPAALPLLFGKEDLAVIVYTSGTTGRSKGAMLTHANLLHNVESCRQMLRAMDHDRFVVVLPLFHSFMMTVGMLLPLLVGGSLVLIKSVHPPKNLVDEIMRRGATILPAIPQLFRALAAASVPSDWPLRLCISGGAPLPREILREFNARMPIPLIEGYGLSEASPVVSLNPIQGPWKEGSIGIPIPGVEVTIQDDAGEILAPEMRGELCVRGDNVMRGYWNKPEETARALRHGWLLTGDIGYHDSEGYFFITDRKKDMLLVNGINVYPREIEEVIYQFPGVKEAAVIGVPDARRGEHPVAFVSAKDATTLEEKALLQFIRERLADYKVPRRIVFLAALPRNATGKVLKTALRQAAL